MPYTPNSWVDGPAGNTPITAAQLSHIETQYAQATAYTDASNASHATGMLGSQNGLLYNGTDEGGALNTLLTSAATFGVTVLLDAGKTLSASTAITPPTGSRLNLNGATIKVLAAAGASTRIITIQSVSDVQVFGGTIDGDKASYAPVTEQRHNILISNSTRIQIRNIRSLRAKGDGVYVGDNISGYSSDVYLEKVICDSNWRNGMSISHVDGFTAVGCSFINTGGTAPQCGVDVEPNSGSIVCQNIKFVGCQFNSNASTGFQASLVASPSARQGGIDLIGCTFASNTGDGVVVTAGFETRIIGGEIRSNGARGFHETSARVALSSGTKLDGAEIRLNGMEGIAVTYGVDGFTVTGCTVTDNGQNTSNTYNGIDLSPTQASANIRLIGNRSGGAQQKYGLLTNSNCSSVTLAGNLYPSNATGTVSLADAIASRVAFEGGSIFGTSALTLRSTAGTSLIALWNSADTNLPRTTLRNDGSVHFGDGTVLDVGLSRTAAGILAQDAGNVLKTGQNITASRPTAATVGKGAQFYDTTLNLPIWSDGTNWKNAAGTTV
jgi:hypothetical protein